MKYGKVGKTIKMYSITDLPKIHTCARSACYIETYHIRGTQENAVKYGKVGKTIKIYSTTDPPEESDPVGTKKKYIHRTRQKRLANKCFVVLLWCCVVALLCFVWWLKEQHSAPSLLKMQWGSIKSNAQNAAPKCGVLPRGYLRNQNGLPELNSATSWPAFARSVWNYLNEASNVRYAAVMCCLCCAVVFSVVFMLSVLLL